MDGQGNECDYYCPDGSYVFSTTDLSANPHVSIFTCFWVMLITITTVGYGDVFPVTLQGRIVAILAMIFGIIYTAMPLAIVGSFFFDAYDKQKKAVQTPEKLMSSTRTRIPAHAAPAIERWLSGDRSTEGMAFKTLTQKIRDDVDMMLCNPKSKKKKKKKSAFGNLLGTLGAKKNVEGQPSMSTPVPVGPRAHDHGDENQKGGDLEAGTTASKYAASPANGKPLATPESQQLQETKAAEAAAAQKKAAEEARKPVPPPNILPLVLKRVKRYAEHQQRMVLAVGRVVHYMIAERQNADILDDHSSESNMMHH